MEEEVKTQVEEEEEEVKPIVKKTVIKREIITVIPYDTAVYLLIGHLKRSYNEIIKILNSVEDTEKKILLKEQFMTLLEDIKNMKEELERQIQEQIF